MIAHENHDRHRRVVSADQRCGQHAGADRGVAGPFRSRSADAHARATSATSPARPTRKSACRCFPTARLQRSILAFAPQALHIATEGPLGLSARRFCLRRGMRFTTSYHTQFPQYLRARFPIPLSVSYRALRWFHGAAVALHGEHRLGAHASLTAHGFKNLARWRRGVDTELFKPHPKGFSRPAAPDRRLCRPRRRRKEYRCLPEHALGRHQDRDRRRPRARAAREAVSGRGILPAIDSARISRRTWRPPTSWCFRAAPIPSAWSISRPWPAACRSPPIRSPVRSMSSRTA